MVSIHRILIVLYMTIRVLCFVFRFKSGSLKHKKNARPLNRQWTGNIFITYHQYRDKKMNLISSV